MDPISRATRDFQNHFRRFCKDDKQLILHIETEPDHLEMLCKLLRLEEWQAGNRSPILVFPVAFLDADEALLQMRLIVLEHYRQLKEGLEKEDVFLQDLIVEDKPEDRFAVFCEVLSGFEERIADVLDPPIACWLPTQIGKKRDWRRFVYRMMGMLSSRRVSMVTAGLPDKDHRKALDDMGEAAVIRPFTIDNDESAVWFTRLMGPPSEGHALGTPSGSAAPDVAPPPRPGPAPAGDDQIKTAAAEAGLPPMLTPSEADRLRQHVIVAAKTAGEGNGEQALFQQQAACSLCEEAGVILEQALMTMVLAGYELQFGQDAGAEKSYRRAEELAGSIYALPQLAQIRMALGYLYLKAGKTVDAVHAYEQSAAAAVIDSNNLLYFEALRMAGSCYLKQKDKAGAAACWLAAVERGGKVSEAERNLSTFRDIAGALIDLLKRNGDDPRAQAVQQMVLAAEGAGA